MECSAVTKTYSFYNPDFDSRYYNCGFGPSSNVFNEKVYRIVNQAFRDIDGSIENRPSTNPELDDVETEEEPSKKGFFESSRQTPSITIVHTGPQVIIGNTFTPTSNVPESQEEKRKKKENQDTKIMAVAAIIFAGVAFIAAFFWGRTDSQKQESEEQLISLQDAKISIVGWKKEVEERNSAGYVHKHLDLIEQIFNKSSEIHSYNYKNILIKRISSIVALAFGILGLVGAINYSHASLKVSGLGLLSVIGVLVYQYGNKEANERFLAKKREEMGALKLDFEQIKNQE